MGVKLDDKAHSEGALAYTSGLNIWVLENNTNHLRDFLSNKYNLLSTLYHESLHKQDNKDEKTQTYYSHFDVYFGQMNHDETFKNTTMEYKVGMVQSSMQYLLNANNQDKMSIGPSIQNLKDVLAKYNISVNVTDDYQSFKISYINEKGKSVTTVPIMYEKKDDPY